MLALASVAQAQNLAEGFEADVFAGGLQSPIAMDFAPGGVAYVAEKAGTVKRVDPDGSVHQVLDISGQVGTWQDRGLTGIAIDSQFGAHPYVYLVYTVKPPGAVNSPSVGRVARYEVGSGGNLVNPAIILGTYQGAGSGCPIFPSNSDDCLPGEAGSHTTDLIRSAPDGSLYLSAGDGMTSQTRAIDQRSLAGKILHFDRDGRGLAQHPFCPVNQNLNHACTKVFAMGFRNPWRIALHPDGEQVIVGDVGEGTFEEIDLARGGQSFGWPCYEGPNRYSGFSLFCGDVYAREGGPAAERPPWWHYDRSVGITVVAGPLYEGASFPEAYRGAILVADTFGGWLRAVKAPPGGNPTVAAELGSGFAAPVHLELGPDGESLYVVEIASGRILRVHHAAGQNRRPRAVAEADPTVSGTVPMTVQFDGSGSNDPDGDDLTYAWDFGDGSPPQQGPQPSHTYNAEAVYEATLTVTDPGGLSDSATVEIVAGNEPPEVTIDAPDESFRYVAGQPIALSGHAVDSDDGPIPDANLQWEIVLHHANHTHAFQDPVGGEATFLPNDDHGADSHYRIILRATDSEGLAGSKAITLHPKTIDLMLRSSPPGVALGYAGQDHETPHTVVAASGFKTQISAPAEIRFDGSTWQFAAWEHGGGRSQDFTVPNADTTLTALYVRRPVTADNLLDEIVKLVEDVLRSIGVPVKGLGGLRLR